MILAILIIVSGLFSLACNVFFLVRKLTGKPSRSNIVFLILGIVFSLLYIGFGIFDLILYYNGGELFVRLMQLFEQNI